MPTSKNNQTIEKFLLGLLALIFSIKVLEALCMLPHGDPLYYHLVGPKLWLETSFSQMHHEFIPFNQAGYFDYLYIIPVWIFGATLKAQLMGQLMHMIFSLGAGCLLIKTIFDSEIGEKKWTYLTCIALLTINKSSDFFLYAKNDGVVAFLILLTAITIWHPTFLARVTGLKRSALIGLFMGLAVGVKLSAAFFAAPLFLFMTISSKKIREILVCGFIAFLSFLPIMIRNWTSIKSPLFPALLDQFPGVLTPAILTYYKAHMAKPLTMELLPKHMSSFFLGKLILAFTPVIFFLNFKSKKISPYIYLAPLLGLLLYLFKNGGVLYERFYFPAYFLMLFYLYYGLATLKIPKLAFILVLGLTLADSKIDKSISRIKKTYRMYASSKSDREIVNKVSKLTLFWNYVKEGDYILSDRSSQFFYAPKGARLEQYAANVNAEFIGKCTQAQVSKLSKYQFAILADPVKNPCYNEIRTNWKYHLEVESYRLYENTQRL